MNINILPIDVYNQCLDEWSEECINMYKNDDDSRFSTELLLQLCESPHITWNSIKNHPEIRWVYEKLIMHPNITFKIIKDNPDKKWDYDYISNNPNITWKIIKDNPDIEWNYYMLSMNPNITWKHVCETPNECWNYNTLSLNRNITWEIIRDNPDKDWAWHNVTRNPNITIEIIKENPDKKWHYELFVKNPNMTFKIHKSGYLQSMSPMLQNLDVWYISYLSSHENITWEIIRDNPNENWSKMGLYKNPNITWEIFQEHYYDPSGVYVNFWSICENPNISWEIIKNNEHLNSVDWNTHILLSNSMYISKNIYIRQKMQEWFKKSSLKSEIMANVWHPRNFEKFKYLDSETFGEEF